MSYSSLKFSNMLQNKKLLVFAGLAAYAYYKYSSLTPEAKQKLNSDLKEKAKNIFEKYVPDQAKDLFKTAGNKGTGSEYGTTV